MDEKSKYGGCCCCCCWCCVFFVSYIQRPATYTLLKPKRHKLRCHGFVVHALLLRMHTNVVDFRVMGRLCRREWNWQWKWQSVNQHSWDPRQRTTWSRRVTSDFNSVLVIEYWSVTSSTFFFLAFQHFHDHISVEHDEQPPHTKFDMNRFMVAQDMATWIPN